MTRNLLAEATRLPYTTLERYIHIFDLLYSSLSLDFDMQAQTQSNWCWAATSVSVSRFYWPLSGWDQCEVANNELGLSGCCGSPVPSACNVPWFLDRALTRTSNFVSITGVVTYNQVRDELQAGRVVGARVGWSGGGGHFMVIYGCGRTAGIEYFDIDDPIFGKSQVTVSTFQTAYQGSGSWTHTYFTRSFIPMIWILPRKLTEPFVKKIWEFRPLMQLKRTDLPEKQPDLALAHDVYNLGLDELVERGQPPEQPSFLRVFEVGDEKLHAFFDLSLEGETPEVRQMGIAPAQVELIERALSSVLSQSKRKQKEFELRELRIPALYVDALWLHFADPSEDLLVPYRAPGLLEPFKAYPLAEALEQLRGPASERMQMDDTMGA